jgi:hypothetical protein
MILAQNSGWLESIFVYISATMGQMNPKQPLIIIIWMYQEMMDLS